MKKVRDWSIQKKISGLFLGCFLALLTCVLMILYDVYKEQIYGQLIQRGHYEDELIVHQIETTQQNAESCCNNIIINLNLAIGSKEGVIGKPDKYDQRIKEKILGVMENNFLLFPDINRITIIYENGDMYSKQKNREFVCSTGNQSLIQSFQNANADTLGVWYDSSADAGNICFLKVFRDIRGNVQIGYVLLELEESILYKTYQNKKTDNPSEIYVSSENEVLLSSTQRDLVNEVYQETEMKKRKTLSEEVYRDINQKKKDFRFYVQEYKTSQGWNVVTILNVKAVMQGLKIISNKILCVGGILMISFSFFTLLLLKQIINPVVALAAHMRKMGIHRLKKIEERESRDEVGVLITSFNQMVEMNGKLIRKIAQDEKEKKQLELSLLQMQIKPHFLYNTLDTAFCLNSMKKHKEANQVLKQLAGYYRLVLNHGDEWISFSEELDAVEKYLAIQSMRYSDQVTYSISVDEEMYEFRIPKMTLQPLVENSIYHGIKPSGREGHILITGELCNEEAIISVTDDGVGMTEEMFEAILSGKQQSTDQESFGMKSVMERMHLFYGNDTKMELSKVPIGTSIVLTINLKKEEGNKSEISGIVGG